MKFLKFERKATITEKFILFFLSMYIISFGTITATLYLSGVNALTTRTFEQLTSVRTVKKRQIESFFYDRLNDAINLSNAINNLNRTKPDQQLNYLMIDFINSNRYFDAAAVYSEHGDSLFTFAPPNTQTKFPKRLMDSITKVIRPQSTIQDFRINPLTGLPELYITFKLNSHSKSNIVLLRVSTSKLNYIMLENNPHTGLGSSGESYLVAGDHLLRSESRFIKNSILRIPVYTEQISKALRGESGTIEAKDYRGIPVLSSFEHLNIPGLKWALAAEIDLDESMETVNTLRRNIFIMSITFSLAIFILTYILTRMVTRPLVKLIDATNKIGKGDFSSIIPITSNDEIGDLTNSFNILTETLAQKEKELKNERLKRFSLVMDSQEEEKERLSKELHDEIGQIFIALKLKLESLDNDDSPNPVIEDVKKSMDYSVDEIRRISNNLMPAVLNEFGIVTAVRNLCSQLDKSKKINIEFISNFEDDIDNPKTKIYTFRIIQEALNNIFKHSEASEAEVMLLKSQYGYKIRVSDNGKGFKYDDALKGSGNGLYNIRERALALNGTFSIKSDQGTIINIIIPFGNK